MYAARKGAHVLPAHRTFDTGYWMLPILGSNVAPQQACECNPGHRFSVGSVGQKYTTARSGRQGGKRSCDGRGRFASHPRILSGPRVPRHIFLGVWTRTPSIVRHWMCHVTVSSIAVKLELSVVRSQTIGCQGLIRMGDRTLRGCVGRRNNIENHGSAGSGRC